MVELGSFEVERDEQEERGVVTVMVLVVEVVEEVVVTVSWEWVEGVGKR